MPLDFLSFMVLIGLAASGFLLAVVSVLLISGPILGVGPEAFSRGCTNLALIAIALGVWSKQAGKQH